MSNAKTLTRREMLKTGGTMAAAATAVSLVAVSKAHAGNKGLPRWAMVLDMRRCTGCRACVIAHKTEYQQALGIFGTVVKNVEWGKFPDTKKVFMARLCNHCSGGKEDVPPCVKICPQYPDQRKTFVTPDGKKHRYKDGATYKRPDGMILVDNSKCIGCGKCITECPYGVRSFDPFEKAGKEPTKQGISKCTFCQHRVDKGVTPACATSCPGRARIFGDLNDPDSQVAKLAKEFNLVSDKENHTKRADKGTDPHNFYIDSPHGGFKKYNLTDENKEAEFKGEFV